MKILKVLRGMIGTAVTWGLAWIPLSAGLWAASGLLGGPPMELWGPLLLGAGVKGAISGAAFGGLLSLVARRRSFSELTFPQLMACGAVGALIAPAITFATLIGRDIVFPPWFIGYSMTVGALSGAVTAAGTLYAARRAPELAAADELTIDRAPTSRALR